MKYPQIAFFRIRAGCQLNYKAMLSFNIKYHIIITLNPIFVTIYCQNVDFFLKLCDFSDSLSLGFEFYHDNFLTTTGIEFIRMDKIIHHVLLVHLRG